MAKYSGDIGFAMNEETAPGVWNETIVERDYDGDVSRNRTQWQIGGSQYRTDDNSINGSISLSNMISILADPFAYEFFYSMRYITYLGKKWVISSIEVEYPRLVLTIGGLYNVWKSWTSKNIRNYLW